MAGMRLNTGTRQAAIVHAEAQAVRGCQLGCTEQWAVTSSAAEPEETPVLPS